MMENIEAILANLTAIQKAVVESDLPIEKKIRILKIIDDAQGMVHTLLQKERSALGR